MHLFENLDKIFRTKFRFFFNERRIWWKFLGEKNDHPCKNSAWENFDELYTWKYRYYNPFFFAIQICKIKFYSKLKRRKFPFFLKKKRTVHSADLAIKKIRLEDKIEKRPMRSKKLNSNYLECFLLRPTRPDHVPSGGSRLPAHERYSNLVVVHLSPISDLPLPIGHRWNRTI